MNNKELELKVNIKIKDNVFDETEVANVATTHESITDIIGYLHELLISFKNTPEKIENIKIDIEIKEK